MRIVDVCAFYTPHGGGVRTYVHRKLAAATAAGHEMIVLAPGASDSVVALSTGGILATIAAPTLPVDRRYRYFADEPALHRALDRWNPDIVEASSPWASAAMVARWPRPAIRALIMHADPMSAYAYRWFGRIASTATIDRRFDRFWRHLRHLDEAMDVVVSSSPDLSYRLQRHGLRKVSTIPMGVEPGVFSSARRDGRLRGDMLARCGLPDSAALLIGVGRYSTEKRWEMVIDAAIAAGTQTPVGLLLVGEGRGRRGLIARVAGCPHIVVGEAIRNREALAASMASADALVHGCESETFCMVAAEATASGLPVIAPDRGGAFDHVRGTRGRHYNAADAASLKNAITAFTHDRAQTPWDGIVAPVRTMDEHFGELFSLYEGLRPARLLAA